MSTIAVSVLSLSGAERVSAAALAEAGRKGARVSVALVDAAGHLLAFRRMDGAACQSARKSAPGSAPNFDPPFG